MMEVISSNKEKMMFLKKKIKNKLVRIEGNKVISSEPVAVSRIQSVIEGIIRKEKELNNYGIMVNPTLIIGIFGR